MEKTDKSKSSKATSRKPTLNKKSEDVIELDRESYERLVQEYRYRVDVLREEIASELAAAIELGDISENYGYTLAMEKKDMNEARIAMLEDLLSKAKIVELNISDSVVGIGETVEIQNLENGLKKIVTLVGEEKSQSADPLRGLISIDSPVGKALYNAKVGSVVEVNLGNKVVRYKICRFVS
ncbi:MAG: transcription elongation factor GreA [Candidatus Dojkabacteria bacterium]|nr:transcription elongation factor GreA [Candidatus Dojkabacteria bacterium]